MKILLIKDSHFAIAVTIQPLPLNSRKWLTCNFSLQYPYIIQQAGNENTLTYQVEFVVLISLQILLTYLQGNAQQLEGELTIRSCKSKS